MTFFFFSFFFTDISVRLQAYSGVIQKKNGKGVRVAFQFQL